MNRAHLRVLLAGALCVAAILAMQACANATPRDTLGERLAIIYVANPNAAPGTPYMQFATQRLDNARIMRNEHMEPVTMFWDDRDRDERRRLRLRRMHMLVKALLCDTSHGGDARLQEVAARIIGFGDPEKLVRINILDDLTTGIYATMEVREGGETYTVLVAEHLYEATVDEDSQRAWACATHYARDPVVQGVVCLGAWDFTYHPDFRSGRDVEERIKACFLHELMHTQDRSDRRADVYGRFRYGQDEEHWMSEAVPNRAAAYMEGIANAMSMIYSRSERRRAYEWFAEGYINVEMDPRNPGTGEPTPPEGVDRSMWLPSRIWGMSPRPQPTYESPTHNEYRLSDMPPDVVASNECVIAMILAACCEHRSEEAFFQRMARANDELFEVTTSHLATLYNRLSEGGDMLPLALTDYFIGSPETLTIDQLRQFMELESLQSHPFNAVCQRYIQRRPQLREQLQSTGSIERDIERIARATAQPAD